MPRDLGARRYYFPREIELEHRIGNAERSAELTNAREVILCNECTAPELAFGVRDELLRQVGTTSRDDGAERSRIKGLRYPFREIPTSKKGSEANLHYSCARILEMIKGDILVLGSILPLSICGEEVWMLAAVLVA